MIFDRAGYEDYALLEQSRGEIITALAACRLLDDHGPERVGCRIDGIAHGTPFKA